MLKNGIAGIALSLLAATALACGATQPPASPGGAAPSSGSDQPKPGGVLKTRITSDVDNFDVTLADKAVANRYTPLVSSRLLAIKADKGTAYGDATVIPSVAEKWAISPDAKTFTFTLRKGVKWQNLPPVNGRDLTAADVKWSFEYQTRTGELKDKKLPPGQFAWMLEGLDSVEAPDASTLVVKFKEPFASFVNYTASTNLSILAKEIFAKDGDFHATLVGTGPFQFDQASSQSGTKFVYKKNPTYFKPGQPYLDELQELVIKDDATAFAAFATKQIDIIYADGVNSANTISKASPQAVQNVGGLPQPTNIYVNSRPGAQFNDLRLRQALALGINRDEFIQTFSGGKGGWAVAGGLPDTMSQDEVKKVLKYDPEAAKKLVEDAGFKNGIDVEWLHFADDSSEYISEIQLLQAQLKKVGINITMKPYERQDAINRRRAGNFSLSGVGKALEPDAESYLYQVFYPKAGNNYGGVDDPKLTDLIVAQRKESDPKKRSDIIKEAVRYVNAEKVWGLALYYKNRYEFAQPYLGGNFPNFWGQFQPNPIDSVWLDK